MAVLVWMVLVLECMTVCGVAGGGGVGNPVSSPGQASQPYHSQSVSKWPPPAPLAVTQHSEELRNDKQCHHHPSHHTTQYTNTTTTIPGPASSVMCTVREEGGREGGLAVYF